MSTSIEPLGPENVQEAQAYLAAHEDTAQFLINNLREHGFSMDQHPNSGNFKLIREGGAVGAVFCLTRRGNLLAQMSADHAREVLQACREESIPIKGFVGDWLSIAPIFGLFRSQRPDYVPGYDSKEILYAYDLRPDDLSLSHDARVRFLEKRDFPQWLDLEHAYLEECSLPDDLTREQAQQEFSTEIQRRTLWGLFGGAELISRAALNSKGEGVGQVGGVFTPMRHRRKGYARATMLHLMKDCRDVHGHRKSLLFTGEADVAAIGLYESLGYRAVGSFALIFGRETGRRG
ncbi:MAG: GNAT family N-acetyltransferase [Steroidobacteraceae bacterium]